ncbi:MAG: aminotransferase class V-fold PLP-dependent enzyme [Firmicutes bacterium]|nr:aminotransferase class V-fold PLP-dependent enzyme [Bacillota bacterium]MCL1954121.1 aminotransferase class V-fold PLP-dependent enzyme [Bacillota bacterium]
MTEVVKSKIAYFDNAATTFVKPKKVHDFMHEFYSSYSTNIGRGEHYLQQDGVKIISQTRQMLLDLFHANSNYVAVLTSTATEAINTILQGHDYDNGKIVYISPFEHNAVYRTVKYLEESRGIVVKQLVVDKTTLQFDIDGIRSQFESNKPYMTICSHVSNVCGNISPIDKIGKIANEYGSIFVVDAAQSAGVLDIDIVNCYADYIVWAGHKTLYGSFGCSGFVCKKSINIRPLIYGGIGIDSANNYMPTQPPSRFEAGSYNIMSISGLYEALNWRNQIGKQDILYKEQQNYNNMLSILLSFDNIRIIGNQTNSISIISCVFDNLPIDMMGQVLSRNGVIVRTGLHCAPLAHKFLSTFPSGTVRFSTSYFNNNDDFDILKKALEVINSSI